MQTVIELEQRIEDLASCANWQSNETQNFVIIGSTPMDATNNENFCLVSRHFRTVYDRRFNSFSRQVVV